MWTAIATGLRVVLGLIRLGDWLARWRERREARKAAHTEAERDAFRQQSEALNEQLDEAVRRRPGNARRRLRDGSF